MVMRLQNQVVVRMDPTLIAMMKKVAKARGEDLSDFVRRSVKGELARLSYLSSDEKKALGIQTNTSVVA
jgi:hypothetical protein